MLQYKKNITKLQRLKNLETFNGSNLCTFVTESLLSIWKETAL